MPKIVTIFERIVELPVAMEDLKVWEWAWPLHNTYRYGAQTPLPFSVIDHLVLGSQLLTLLGASDRTHLAWLLHDAAEGFVGDVANPIKKLNGMEGFRVLENGCRTHIDTRFLGDNQDDVDWDTIEKVDRHCCYVEMSILFPGLRMDERVQRWKEFDYALPRQLVKGNPDAYVQRLVELSGIPAVDPIFEKPPVLVKLHAIQEADKAVRDEVAGLI